ncbi:hypothetical protein JCM19039_1311 [Geomicrobium sp. JCM 19039]|nr:hypothetical protein JCM19039_1311 [Geomicrobium sp. JCM 19039]
MEAMATGTPVVASRVGGLPSLLSEGAGILVEAKQPEQLGTAITSALMDSPERKAIITAGYKKAEQHDSEAIIQQIARIYHDTAEGKSK